MTGQHRSCRPLYDLVTLTREHRLTAIRKFCPLLLVTAAACSDSTRSPVAVVATDSIPASRALLDVAYAPAPAQRIDLYYPPSGNGPFPLVVWIHGGGWSAGSKALSATSPQRQMVAQGYAVASVEYRLSGVARYPAAVLDVKAAIRFLRANSTRFFVRTDRIAAWGSSAGGHLAAMLGVTGGVATFEDASLGNPTTSSRVQAVVDWFGPSDLLTMDLDGATQSCPVFGGLGHDHPSSPEGLFLGGRPSAIPSVAREASPVTWVSADDPPHLIQHGGRDCTVPTNQGRRLRDLLRASLDSSRVSWTELPNDGHGGGGFESTANVATVRSFLDRWIR